MTAVIRPAEARRAASIMMSNSMIDRWTGVVNGWTMKTSFSRTLSSILTKMFSLVNSHTWILPRLIWRWEATASASAGLALPVNMVMSSNCGIAFCRVGGDTAKWAGYEWLIWH